MAKREKQHLPFTCTYVVTQTVWSNTQEAAERRGQEIMACSGVRATVVPSGAEACNCEQALELQGEVMRLQQRIRELEATRG